jgi:integrase
MSCPCCAANALHPIPFSQFSAEICDIYRAGNQPATLAKVEQILDEFGPLCASTADVNLHAISLWLADPSCRRRPVMTRRSLLSAFRAACALGAGQHYMVNPFLTWDLNRWLPAPDPEDLDRPRLCRSGPEISRILRRASCEAAGGSRRAQRIQALVYLAAYTGARAKEMLGAQTADVDLAAGLFRIRPNARRKLKTRGSRRDLPLHPELAKVLAKYQPGCGTWLIPQRSGRGPWFHGTTGYKPHEVVQQLGERVAVEGLTLESFRHTFATLAEDWGVGELQLQRWLGHTRPQTQRFYRHRRVAMPLLAEAVGLIRY